MAQSINDSTPEHNRYDVIIVGGAMIGSSIAWFLTNSKGFNGSVLVVEKDPSYETAGTSHTNSCMRQQFSREINVRVSQFAADYVQNFRAYMNDDPRIPEVHFHKFGYMYLAGDECMAEVLRTKQKMQKAAGAGTRFLLAEEIKRDYPFYNLNDIVAGNHNLIDEGYFDGNTLFEWWKRSSREAGVEFVSNEVVSMNMNAQGTAVDNIKLATGGIVSSAVVVNASGTRAAVTAKMAGIKLPVEPRKRYTYVFAAENPLDRDLPLTVDPSGVHVRSDGAYYMAGCPPNEDSAVEFNDFSQDHSLWEEKVWPAIAHRIPQFEAIKLINSWAGHYAYNTFDQNAILGAHPKVSNFYFANGFSGHGFQQAPAVGRGIAELINYGEYRSLDMREFSFSRLESRQLKREQAVI